MSLKDYLEANKKKPDMFVAIYNKDDRWIIAGPVDDSRLVDYYSYNILSESKVSANIVKLQTDYPAPMQVGYYRMKAEATTTVTVRSTKTESPTSKRKRKK